MANFVSVEHANLIKRDNNKSILVNGEQAVEQIAEDLGILTDISTIKDKKIVVLEGKWDQIAIEQQIIPAILNLDELKMWQEKVILLPAGGTNIDNWQKAHTLDQFKIPYYIIIDGDDAGTKYVKNGLSNEFKLNRPTMEFYLPYTYMDMILNKVYFPGKLGIQEYCNEPDLTIEEAGWNADTNGFIFGEKGIELFYNRIYHFLKVEGKKSIKSSKFKEHTWLNIPKNTITIESLQVLRCNESTAYDEWRGIVETILKDTTVSVKSK
ncbi:TOPRIM nucleotidyl transferase/hydrolase domain-containing protein [Periweissella fabalis]|uniref:OLD protein-like TOPRIM domain-containing protein n=1 Tax=Periweissella fabalis TaxID=1070421 RepID=A0A7X6N109_9LACO|nr:TOPRIM nucleotidyl transferase/hydrolase domain-containing protein [Periweissella fabalis]MCM0599511.1 hypothetical protein [Periweissella fabalis]NKZ23816.1 hypothetical protein [Periweissella fabalis]